MFWSGFGALVEGEGGLPSDIPATTATTATLIVGQSAYGTIGDPSDVDLFRVELVAGQTYEFRLLGIGATHLSDPYLRLYDAGGFLVTFNDDGMGGAGAPGHDTDSRLVFTATTTGTYYLGADNYSTETGDYLLTVAPRDVNGMVFTVDEIAWQLINPATRFSTQRPRVPLSTSAPTAS